MTSKIGTFLIATAAAALCFEVQTAQADIYAEGIQNILIRNGDNAGRTRRDANGREQALNQAYAGIEHTTMVQLSNNELLIVGMASYELNGQPAQNRMQGACASVTLDAIAGPTVQSFGFISANNGDDNRNFNHPEMITLFGGEVAYLEYNVGNNNNNRAERQAMVLGPGCQILQQQTLVQRKNNDDCSETGGQQSAIVVEQTETTARLYNFDGCNGNGEDDAWLRETLVTRNGPTSFTTEKVQDFSIEANEERTRGFLMATADPNLALACWSAGNTQPTNRGVRCAGLDTSTAQANIENRLLWRQYVARREDNVYRTQMRLANVLDAEGNPTSMILAQWQEMVDPGRRRGRGAAITQNSVLNITREGFDMMNAPNSQVLLGMEVAHSTVAAGMWGVDGQTVPALFALEGSIVGQPDSSADFGIMAFDPANRTLVDGRVLATGAAIDGAWISNIYGNNPNTQGRNFIMMLPNVRNPGYQLANGFQPEVKLFTAIPAATRRIREGDVIAEDKLALELVLIPQVVAPDTPKDPDPIDQIEPPGPGDTVTPPGGGSSGALGGCSAGGSAPGGFLALLGLAFIVAIRRRK